MLRFREGRQVILLVVDPRVAEGGPSRSSEERSGRRRESENRQG